MGSTSHSSWPQVTTVLATNTLHSWLDLAVGSLLAQDYPNHEVVVVHDGIPIDSSRSWACDSRVTCVVVATSSGLANALNAGYERASGDFLARLDADDLSHPTRISRQVALFQRHPSLVLCGTLAYRIDESGRRIGVLGADTAEDLKARLLTRNVLIHSSTMFRREAYARAGGYDGDLTQMEDYLLWLRMALHGEVRNLQQPLVEYRVHAQQLSRRAGFSGAYISRVLEARLSLAESLGRTRTSQRARNAAWWCAQFLRARGLRSPGYDR